MAIKVTLNRQATGKLLKSAEMQGDLRRRAERIARTAGPGHKVEVGTTRQRARAAVVTEDFEAIRSEATNRTLTRAIDAGRG